MTSAMKVAVVTSFTAAGPPATFAPACAAPLNSDCMMVPLAPDFLKVAALCGSETGAWQEPPPRHLQRNSPCNEGLIQYVPPPIYPAARLAPCGTKGCGSSSG